MAHSPLFGRVVPTAVFDYEARMLFTLSHPHGLVGLHINTLRTNTNDVSVLCGVQLGLTLQAVAVWSSFDLTHLSVSFKKHLVKERNVLSMYTSETTP